MCGLIFSGGAGLVERDGVDAETADLAMVEEPRSGGFIKTWEREGGERREERGREEREERGGHLLFEVHNWVAESQNLVSLPQFSD